MSEYLRPSMRGMLKKGFERMRISLDVQRRSGYTATFH